jgi:hypothetical protein
MQLYSILFDLQVVTFQFLHIRNGIYFIIRTSTVCETKERAACFKPSGGCRLLRRRNYKIAEQLLAKGMYTYVGSDVHHDKHIAAFEQKSKDKRFGALKEAISNNQFSE